MQANSKSQVLLDDYQLRKTPCREEVLQLFLNNEATALSQQEIIEQLSHQYDRVTLYRTLKTFEEKGLIHKVNLAGNESKYAMGCHPHCEDDVHHHEGSHIHFQCENCDQITCLTELPVKEPVLPSGYEKHKSEFLITGICRDCNLRQN